MCRVVSHATPRDIGTTDFAARASHASTRLRPGDKVGIIAIALAVPHLGDRGRSHLELATRHLLRRSVQGLAVEHQVQSGRVL